MASQERGGESLLPTPEARRVTLHNQEEYTNAGKEEL